MNNLLIVEGKTDKPFIELLASHLQIAVNIGAPICNVDDYECLNGLENLEKYLVDLPKKIASKNISKVGIMIDADEEGVPSRVKLINEKLKTICSDVVFERVNEPKYSEELAVTFVCYIVNVEGAGELETLLKLIKSRDSVYADCLESWRECLNKKEKNITDKKFRKIWLYLYDKYDTEKEKDIWNFDHEALDGLKEFLRLLSSKEEVEYLSKHKESFL